jgi:electron transport complex protein RnfG
VKRNVLSIVVAALTLTLIAGVTTALLAATNLLTKDTIASRNEQIENQTRMQVLAADKFEAATVSVDGADVTYYKGSKNGELIGYVFTVTTTGKSAGLTVMTGVDTDGKVTGVAVTDDSETAGYVDKVTKAGLLERIAGQTSTDGVDTVSQATKTSKGILRGVDGALKAYQAIAGGAADE